MENVTKMWVFFPEKNQSQKGVEKQEEAVTIHKDEQSPRDTRRACLLLLP